MIKTTYRGVKIEEVWNIPKTYTLFTTDLPAHSDTTIKMANVLGLDLEHVKREIDTRLQELGLEEFKK